MKTEQKSVSPTVQRQWLLEELERRNLRVFYNRRCVLPCLEVDLILKERGREEIGAADLLLLNLIGHGIVSVKSLEILMGLQPRPTRLLLTEMIGRGLVSDGQDRLTLTALGKESLQLGVPVRHVRRALRYCTITQRLLPKDAYQHRFEKLTELSPDMVAWKDILGERDQVSLDGLAFDAHTDKHALNIPDEATGIERMVGYSPAYLQAELCIVGRDRPDEAFLVFGKTLTAYPIAAVRPLQDQFDGHRVVDNKTKATVFDKIKTQLISAGVVIEEPIRTDAHGLPKVTVLNAPDAWLIERLDAGMSAIQLCGTKNSPARPVTRFPFNQDVLEGHAMQFVLSNAELERAAEGIRAVNELADGYFRTPPADREFRSVAEHLRSALTEDAWLEVKEQARRYGSVRMKGWFGLETDNAPASFGNVKDKSTRRGVSKQATTRT